MPATVGTTISASSVAQFLKRHDINTVPRGREGVHVSGTGTGRVALSVLIERPRERQRLVLAVMDALLGLHSPYHVSESALNVDGEPIWSATITRKAV